MRNRLVCLVLSLIMLLSVLLTGCSTQKNDAEAGDDIIDEASNNAITLTMWVISEKKIWNNDAERAEYLEKECGGDTESQKYKDMEAVTKAYEEVEAAFTKITKAKLKTNVDLLFYTEDEYKAKLTENMETHAMLKKTAEAAKRALKRFLSEASADGETDTEAIKKEFYEMYPQYVGLAEMEDEDEEDETAETEEETFLNDYGVLEIKYPDTEEGQIDIIYISGYEDYMGYIKNEQIQDLTEELAGSAKKLKQYISSTLLSGIQVDGSTYAIPNNITIGEYNYMLINKELYDKYYHNISDVVDIRDCKLFLEDVTKYEENVCRINADFNDCMKMFAWFWDIDYEQGELNEARTNAAIAAAKEHLGDKYDSSKEQQYYKYDNIYTINNNCDFSFIGTYFKSADIISRGKVNLDFTNILSKKDFTEGVFLPLMEYKFNNYFETAKEGQECAVTFLKGDQSVEREYKENGYYTADDGKKYYVVVAEYPQATDEDLYGNMFGVTSSTKSLSRSMDLLTYLNTNSELRNLLQYGVEGKNYELTDSGKTDPRSGDVLYTLKRTKENLYLMDIKKTGNEFIAYPEEGMAADVWVDAKEQNRISLINPLLGFNYNDVLSENDADLDTRVLDFMKEKSADISARIAEIENDGTLTTKMKVLALTELINTIVKNEFTNASAPLMTKTTNKSYDTEASADPFGESPATIYNNWLIAYNYGVAGLTIPKDE